MKLIRKDRSAVRATRPDLEVIPHLDCLAPRDVICEVSGIEVAEHRSDGDEQFRTLDLLKDLRVSDGSDVDLEMVNESLAVVT